MKWQPVDFLIVGGILAFFYEPWLPRDLHFMLFGMFLAFHISSQIFRDQLTGAQK
jgi:hypothetical protein